MNKVIETNRRLAFLRGADRNRFGEVLAEERHIGADPERFSGPIGAAGPPLDLSKWDGAQPTAANLYALTDEIMTVLRDMLVGLRGEPSYASVGNLNA